MNTRRDVTIAYKGSQDQRSKSNIFCHLPTILEIHCDTTYLREMAREKLS
jgi:hypothetical protein